MRCSVLGDDQKESTVEVLQGCYKHWLRCSGQNPADIVAKLWAVKRDKRCLHKVVQHRALCATEQELTFHLLVAVWGSVWFFPPQSRFFEP